MSPGAAAVHEHMGPIGYWLVIAVATLAFLSAGRQHLGRLAHGEP